MNLQLDDILLIQKKVDDQTHVPKFISSIYNIDIQDKRSIVEHKIPGMRGGVLQDMGREPMEIIFEGIILGEEAKQILETIRNKFNSGRPIRLLSDLTGIAEINKVLIQDFNFLEEKGFPNQYKYDIKIREYIEPPQDDDPPPNQEEEAEEEAGDEADSNLGSINYVIGKVLNTDSSPKTDINIKISYDGGEYVVKTDEDGIFRKDDLEPGTYSITIDTEGYKGVVKEVIIKSGLEKAEIIVKEEETEKGEIEEEEEEEEEL